jgi:hypothetical protein
LLRKLSERSAWFLFERTERFFSTYRGAPTAFLGPQGHPHFQPAFVLIFGYRNLKRMFDLLQQASFDKHGA